jgi:predicted TIM-barrel fold metal-dependent hydrolase
MSSINNLEYQKTPIWKRVSQNVLRQKPWISCPWQEQLRSGVPLTDLSIIDGHAHLGEYAGFYIDHPDAQGMVEVMDWIGMQAAILSSNAAIRSNPRYGNQITLEATRLYPGRLYGYVVANPYYAEEMEEELKSYLAEPGIVAIKLHPELHDNYPMNGPRYEPMWNLAAERRIPVLFHTYFGGDSLEAIVNLARKYPSVPLLVGHMLQDKSMEAMAELANSFENIYIDLTVPEIYGSVEFFVEAVDVIEKIIFGTDFPWGNCHFRVGAVVYARISEEQKRKILGENAARLFGIPLP